MECLPRGADGRPAQQRNRGKHIRAMSPALFVRLKRKIQLGMTERVLLVQGGNHLESPAAAFCCSRMQKPTNHLKFKACACAKWEND